MAPAFWPVLRGQAGRLSYVLEDVGAGVALTRRFANACAHHATKDFGTGVLAGAGPFSFSGDRRDACPTPNRLNT
ncbi:MAG: hypothetical protein KME26_20975 [Oscillatoria princeps RMCB-10]|nr:hypothetical protein [Oscillatoria princeps RMCB-10]